MTATPSLWPPPNPTLYGTTQSVSSGHYLASSAAFALLEDRFDDEVYAELERRGHDVRKWPPFTGEAAAVEAIYRNARTGFLESAADARQPAQAVVA